jgi:hypothetical protein
MIDHRFWSYVHKTENCWLWTAGKFASGYGQFRNGKRKVKAHRYSYETLIGPVPDGLCLDHLCRVKACVNPAHLEAVTQVENIRRTPRVNKFNTPATHCPSGHEWNAANTRIEQGRYKRCIVCDRDRHRARFGEMIA